ncbi:MAG TPA: efflux RND transporter permease subunit [Anaeromyxobacter sp.]|nr:efflux RND transporter permease subunit [Anaeromyxobacter sp.]
MWLTRLALKNPVFILMMSLMTLALGWVSLTRLSVDLFPQIDIPIIRVATFYTGAGPIDIEKSITMPIERAVAASPGVDRVESSSKQGVSLVSVWFQYGTNLDNAQFDVSQRIAQILNTLPPGIQQPFVLKFDITNIPVVQIAMSGEGLDEKQLYDLGYNVIEPQLERIPGVASATVGGGKVREIEVMVHRDALRARGLGILDVVNAVRGSNLLFPSGDLRAGVLDYNVFSNTSFGEARPIRNVVIRAPDAAGTDPVRISDVARVEDATADQTEIVRINGQRGVYFRVLKQPGANTVAVVDAVQKAVDRLRGVPPNVKLAISFDQSSYIRAAIASLEHEAVTGGLLAVAVILLFLVSFSATGIIAVAIPLSIVATFVLLYFTGQTLNVFTLGGLALGVGRLVDDSIVELENIHRHLALGQDRKTAVLNAAQEVAMPIFVSTITTIVVFFPVVFLTGVARNLFMPLALTIAFALIMSFFVSRTVTPILCLKYLKAEEPGHGGGIGAWVTRKFAELDELYARSLQWVLRHRGRVIAGILVAFVASLLLKSQIGTEFFPDTDESQFQIIYKTPIGTRVEKTEAVTARLEETVVKSLHEDRARNGSAVVTTMISDTGLPVGRSAIFTSNTGPHSGNLNVNLVSKVQRRLSDNDLADRVRQAISRDFPGTQVYFFVGGIVKRVLNFGSPAPVDVEIVGYDLEAGGAYAKLLQDKLRNLSDKDGRPLLTDLQISREENYPELDVVVDREKAGRLGLSETDIAQTVLTSLAGSNQFSPIPYIDAKTGNQYYINVRLDDAYRSHVQDLPDIFVRAPGGTVVNLANIASVKRSAGPVLVNRKYLQRIIDVTANVAPGKDLGSASAAVQKTIDDMPPPDGFTAQLGGQTAAQREAFAGLAFAALMAIGLVYMILASQFRSLLDPLVIMFSVPLGITGVFVALWATHTTLSVNSFMGIIMMVGIVVSNGVLLVDFARVLQSRGVPLIEATVQAGKTRLRPILMTTIATIAGLFPMALGMGEGSETNLPLARAVIGGLTISTFFTLFLIPSLYTLLERFSKNQHREDEDEGGGLPQPTPSPHP